MSRYCDDGYAWCDDGDYDDGPSFDDWLTAVVTFYDKAEEDEYYVKREAAKKILAAWRSYKSK